LQAEQRTNGLNKQVTQVLGSDMRSPVGGMFNFLKFWTSCGLLGIFYQMSSL
jgi:hypothetical protein